MWGLFFGCSSALALKFLYSFSDSPAIIYNIVLWLLWWKEMGLDEWPSEWVNQTTWQIDQRKQWWQIWTAPYKTLIKPWNYFQSELFSIIIWLYFQRLLVVTLWWTRFCLWWGPRWPLCSWWRCSWRPPSWRWGNWGGPGRRQVLFMEEREETDRRSSLCPATPPRRSGYREGREGRGARRGLREEEMIGNGEKRERRGDEMSEKGGGES